jgi:hypothetical protein
MRGLLVCKRYEVTPTPSGRMQKGSFVEVTCTSLRVFTLILKKFWWISIKKMQNLFLHDSIANNTLDLLSNFWSSHKSKGTPKGGIEGSFREPHQHVIDKLIQYNYLLLLTERVHIATRKVNVRHRRTLFHSAWSRSECVWEVYFFQDL